MQVKFYKIEKKQNSTLLPTSTPVTYDCTIKDSCSILAPVIKLDIGLTTSPTIYNYAYIEDWGRYYFINDWVFNSRLWQAQLSVDVLATYKIQIGNYTGYVLRSASSYSGDVADTTYPQKSGLTGYQNKIKFSGSGSQYHTWLLGDETKSISVLKSDEDFEITDGYYYVTMLCDTSSSANKYNTYVMSYSEYAKLINNLFNTDYSSYSKGSLTNDVYKYLADPLQWIVSVKWCPFRVPGYTFEKKTLQIGGLTNNTYTVTCAEVTKALGMRIEYVIDKVPSHPDFASRGKWVNNEPYIYVELDCQPFGSLTLDRAKIPTTNDDYSGGVTIMWDVDIHTGLALARVYGTGTYAYNIEQNGALLGTVSGSYMVDVPIAQTKTNAVGLIGAGINAIGQSTLEKAQESANPTILQSEGSTIIYGVSMPNTAINDLNTRLYSEMQESGKSSELTELRTEVGQTLSNIGSVLTGSNLTVSTRGTQGAYIGVRDPFIDCWWTSMVDEDNEHSGRPLCKDVKLNTLSGFILCRDGDISLDATQQEKSAVGKYLTSGFFYE